MDLDIKFFDYKTNNLLGSISNKLTDFSLRCFHLYLMKYGAVNCKPNHFKNHVRHTIHCLLAKNYSKMRPKIVNKLSIVDTCAEIYFGTFNSLNGKNPDIFKFQNDVVFCFPQKKYYKSKIVPLLNLQNLAIGNYPFVVKRPIAINTTLNVLINYLNPSKKAISFCFQKVDFKLINDFLLKNDLLNSIIEGDGFICKFAFKDDLIDFDIVQVYGETYFGIKILNKPNC